MMEIGKRGLDLIKKYESCRLSAYKAVPTEKYWTIGYGHYGADVKEGQKISQMEAEVFLKEDLKSAMGYVEKFVKVPISQNMFDALVSFVYNVGCGNFEKSTLLKLLNQGKYTDAADEFVKWNKSGGVVYNGLTKRRKDEKLLFLSEIGVLKFSKKLHGELIISKNFKVKEFACKDGSDDILIDVDFVINKLQKIRDYFGAPITINSAYRTPAYNQKVGGAKNSFHMKGQAFDIVIKNRLPEEVAEYAQLINVNGVIIYNTFTHVDNRSYKYWART